MANAPIALFVYKRPEHTRQTLEALIANQGFSQSRLYVFCDGPKSPEDKTAVLATRTMVRSFSLPNITIIERKTNAGLAVSIISGVSEICQRFGRIIVLEDDLITSPHFLEYMNNALEEYADKPAVMQITGYMFPIDVELNEDDAFFLPFISSWGWATWERAWKHFDPLMNGFNELKINRPLRKKFDFNGAYPFYRMLKKQKQGQTDSWAIRWYLSVFLREGLTLYPKRTLVNNIGFDLTGTHCGIGDDYIGELSTFMPTTFPAIELNEKAVNRVSQFRTQESSFFNRAKRKARSILYRYQQRLKMK